MTYKGVAVKLGAVKIDGEDVQAAVCFDTQLMRLSAGWTGDFLRLRNVAFTGDHGPCPRLPVIVKFARTIRPLGAKDGSFVDPRIALNGEPFGGMPRDYLHYKGLYRVGEQVVFSYSVNGMDVLETPVIGFSGKTPVFYRVFQVAPSKIAQTTVVCAVDGAEVPAPEAQSKPAASVRTARGQCCNQCECQRAVVEKMEIRVGGCRDKKGKEIHLTTRRMTRPRRSFSAIGARRADKSTSKISQAVSAMWVT